MDEQKENFNGSKKSFFRGNQSKASYNPLFEMKYNFLNCYKKEELMDLARENYNIYQRLNAKNSSYTLNSHLRDYEKAQYYKKNYCKYPSIDFYRTSKSNSFCSIFNYCTFNNYNHINNEFNNEYNKKRTTYRTLQKNKSHTNMYNTINNQRQKKLNDIVQNHYDLKNYYEGQNKNKNKDYEIEQQNNINKEKEKEKGKENTKNINNDNDIDNYEDEFKEKDNLKNENKKYNYKNEYNGNKDENNNKEEKNNKDDILKNSNNKNDIKTKKNEKGEDKNLDDNLVLLRDKLQYGKDELKEEDKIIEQNYDTSNRNNNEKKEVKDEMNQGKKEKSDEKNNNEKQNNKNKVDDEDDIVSDIMEDLEV